MKRFVIEALVIVVSILLAFSIDAWWDERKERQDEQLLLEGLLADFTEISAALEIVEAEHAEASESCLFLMDLPLGETLAPTPENDRRVALVFLASRTFNPGSGAVASFQNGGAQLIRNKSLTSTLLAWPGLVEELTEEEANIQKGVAERWSPFLATRVSVAPYVIPLGDLMADVPGKIAAPADRQSLVVDEAFINHVIDRYKWQRIALRDIKPVRAAADNIIALIEAELGAEH